MRVRVRVRVRVPIKISVRVRVRVCEPHVSSPVSHAPVALKHVLAPLIPRFAPKASVRPGWG